MSSECWGHGIPRLKQLKDFETRKKTPFEKAEDIMSLLEADDELMRCFNLLLRQKKLRQLKNK